MQSIEIIRQGCFHKRSGDIKLCVAFLVCGGRGIAARRPLEDTGVEDIGEADIIPA